VPFPGGGAKIVAPPGFARTPDTPYQIAPGVCRNYSQNVIPPTALPSARGDGGAGRRPRWDGGAGRRPAASVVDPGSRSWRLGRAGAGKLWSRLHGPARLSSTEARSWRHRTEQVAGEDDGGGSRRSQGAAVGGACGGGIQGIRWRRWPRKTVARWSEEVPRRHSWELGGRSTAHDGAVGEGASEVIEGGWGREASIPWVGIG
jgi:hypothetical protein